MWHYLMTGGPILLVIGCVSLAAGACVFTQLARLSAVTRRHEKGLSVLAHHLKSRAWFEAVEFTQREQHPFFGVWRQGLELLVNVKHEFRDIEEAIFVSGQELGSRLESALKPLGALTTILPMLGFLGTILGLITSFHAWEEMGAQVSISVLAGGIYQAMITTAAALAVAIPYYLIYHYLVARTQKVTLRLSSESTQILRWLKEGLTEIPVESENLAQLQT